MSLKYEPSSEALHISAKWMVFNSDSFAQLNTAVLLLAQSLGFGVMSLGW